MADLRQNIYRATCFQCGDKYEDFVAAIGSRAGHYRSASRSNRNIWAASHCERTGHVRFEIDDVERYVTILRAPAGFVEPQLSIEDDPGYSLMAGTWHPDFDAPETPKEADQP